MRLVKLEIKGFKSFAKETVLHFGEDVIGVVGPNGSGKSNIVDAIRWVLGEQKKGELRLDKMSSVIFNGTKKRKASNVAQVFLTFDNNQGVLRSEFSQLTIGRLLYRNGDSEYRLNGVSCRRKDITDLFVDTGIESNSYAIIALGMVDDILADKDNSRLRMLEQAAGISVYKVRKRETELRLNRTQEDLDRVEDLLHEIDDNLKDLAKQAKRTKRYFELKDKYRELSLDYAYLSSQELRVQLKDLAAQVDTAELTNTEKIALSAKLEQQIEDRVGQQQTSEQHLNEKRRQLNTVSGKLRTAVSDRQLAQQKIEYLSQSEGKLAEQRKKLLEEQTKLRSNIETYTTRLADAKSANDEHASTFESTQARLAAIKTEAETLRSSVRDHALGLQQAESNLLAADKKAALVESRIEAAKFEAAAKARRRETNHERLTNLEEELTEANKRRTNLRTQLDDAEATESGRAVKEQAIRDELDVLNADNQRQRNTVQKLENELTLLQSLVERMEGSSESVKYLANKQGWRDTYPLLSDVVDVEPAYQAAIEAVLAPYLNCFVVPDKATAAEGLRALSEAKQARTHILISEVSAPSNTTMSAFAKTCRPAVEVVTCEPKYESLIALLLKGVAISSEAAAKEDVSRGQTIVDLEGRQVWSSGVALGGKTPQLQGQQTGRRKKLASLGAELEQATESLQQVSLTQKSRQTELQELREAGKATGLQQLRQRFTEVDRLQVSAQARVEGLQVQMHAEKSDDGTASGALDQLMQQLVELNATRGPLVVLRDQAFEQRGTADTDADRVSQALGEASSAFNAANMQAIQHQNTVASFDRELNYATDQLREVEQTLAQSDKALESDGAELQHLKQSVAELNARITEGSNTKNNRLAEVEADEKLYLQERNELADWEKQNRQVQRELQDLSNLLTRLKERRSELQYRIQNLRDRLQIEFNIDLDAALSEDREVTLSLADLEHKISKLKGRLDSYGEINPLAVEAFDAMEERHGNIAGQREDIMQAMDSLRETIDEIDRSATEKLTDAFEAVRGHFVDVFRHLFDAEDTADMIMLDPENPLQSKIEIVAKPKGKRPQTISQLSGGEKTLTATAFLFALYLIKPAPFCIFDEVDAPLDDSNVEKFNRIIKRFSKDSQFIIVTHNKLTMAAVDTIYGVYMPELGVSAVTPVDFREFEHSDVLEMVG